MGKSRWRVAVKTETLTIKVPVEVMEDLEAYARQEFPRPCPKCKGEGVLGDDTTCTVCGGTATVGNRSEAGRFLLHMALGDRASPQARAMMAAYGEIRARLLSVVSATAHRMEAGFREEMIKAIQQSLRSD